MTRGDIVGLVSSYLFAFGLLLVVEAAGRRFGWRQRFTRKLTHIGAGMWVVALVAIFDHWYWAHPPHPRSRRATSRRSQTAHTTSGQR